MLAVGVRGGCLDIFLSFIIFLFFFSLSGRRLDFVVVVALLFYVHGKHLKVMSGRSVSLTTLFLGRLRPPKRLTSISCTYLRQ